MSLNNNNNNNNTNNMNNMNNNNNSPSNKMSRYRQMMAQRRNIKDFEKIKVIGRGAFGEVRLVREVKSGQVMAMKMLKKSEMLKMNQV